MISVIGISAGHFSSHVSHVVHPHRIKGSLTTALTNASLYPNAEKELYREGCI